MAEGDDDMTRAFLVGCPRSGTTLLQSMLGAHPEIAVFPETHFFDRLFEPGVLSRVGVAARPGRRSLATIAAKLGAEELAGHAGWRVSANVRAFLSVLDAAAQRQGCRAWVEKTPGHLRFIGEIESLVPHSRFVHLVRNGADVVASLRDVTIRHPDVWGGERSVEQCVDRWIADVEKSLDAASLHHHFAVRYEDLVDSPARVLERITEFLGVPYDERMAADHAAIASEVVEDEPWKRSALGPLARARSRKFEQVLTRAEREFVSARIREAGLEPEQLVDRLGGIDG